MKDAQLRSSHVSSRRMFSSAVIVSPPNLLLAVWFVAGMLPLALQMRSFLKFVTPHKITESLVVPDGVEKSTTNMTELCPALGLQMAQVWWNIETTHYHDLNHGRVCHYVSPQYNCHGNYLIGTEKVAAYHSAPTNCANESYPVDSFFYHGSIGFYSFYEEISGTYCANDNSMYGPINGLGTFDINGWVLAQDSGSFEYRVSYWYATVGTIWIVYRALVLRRSYITCKRYGRFCEQMKEDLDRRSAMIFVHENMRLSAHGATNYHRIVLLYLLVEGIMSDLFLLVATDGVFAWFQYISLGYNLSGVLSILFELVENTGRLRETSRLFIKRLLFCYECAFLGELLSTIGQSHFLTSLSHSRLKESGFIARAVSYYAWGLVGHSTIVCTLIGFILTIRALCAITYVRWIHGCVWAIFTAPCSVDTTLVMRNKMTLLSGYCWSEGRLYYKSKTLKSFGLLKVKDEDGVEFLAMGKLHWFRVPTNNLVLIGMVSEHCVSRCFERPCSGVVSFFDRKLGAESGNGDIRIIHVKRKAVMPFGSQNPQATNEERLAF